MQRIWKLITTGLEWKDIGPFLAEWWPVVIPVATAAAGYLQSVPVMWIIMATVLTTMGVVIIFLGVMLQLERSNPANKLQWVTVFNCDLKRTRTFSIRSAPSRAKLSK